MGVHWNRRNVKVATEGKPLRLVRLEAFDDNGEPLGWVNYRWQNGKLKKG
jgi:hypothetical protein